MRLVCVGDVHTALGAVEREPAKVLECEEGDLNPKRKPKA